MNDEARVPSPRLRLASATLGLSALVIAAVVVAAQLSPSRIAVSPGPSSAAAENSASPPTEPSASTVPTEVAGLPVVTVAHARELLDSGGLDGQAIAVGGYYAGFFPPCPYPGRYVGPLERWCSVDVLSDTAMGADLCQPTANGTSCQGPSGTFLAPFFVGLPNQGGAGFNGEPTAVILIGHSGDARQWQCTAATQNECAHAFVTDRVAWVQGHDVPVTVPPTFTNRGGQEVTPKMSLAQVSAAGGLGDNVVAAAAFTPGGISAVDPRWNLTGDGLIWLVRTVGPAGQGAETAPETEWLIDDTTGKLIDHQPTAVPGDDHPARVWLAGTVAGSDCCANNVVPVFRVQSEDGRLVYQDVVSGGASGGPNGTTFGGGYGSQPLVLPAGTYALTAWLGTYDGDVTRPQPDSCSTRVTLQELDSITLDAGFPDHGACTIKPALAPTSSGS